MGITIFEHQTISQLSFTLKQPERESCKLLWKRSCKTSVQMSNWNIFIFLQVSWMLTWCCTSCAVTESWRAFAFAGRDFLTELFMLISSNGKKSYYWHILCTLENIKKCTIRALDSFFPLVALLRLTFSVGRTSTWFCRNIFILFCYIMGLINACWWTFIIVYSYMVTKWLTFQPVLFHQ